MSPNGAETVRALLHHLALCQELLALVERESRELHAAPAPSGAKTVPASPGSSTFDFFQRRKHLLPQLDRSLRELQRGRTWWQHLEPDQRKHYPQIDALIRSNQDLVMKVVVLDRENEKARLRLGLIPPNHWPPAQAQQPHYVADLYRRHTSPPSRSSS